MDKPLEVKLVSEDLVMRLAGPALIAIAAIAAAAIAAYVAMHNHRRELEHDRNERQRENTRLVLDGAIEAVISVLGTFADFEGALLAAEDKRSGLESTAEDEDADIEERAAAKDEIRGMEASLERAFKEVTSVTRELAASTARISLRFGVEAPIPVAYDEFGDAYRAYGEVLATGIASSHTQAQREDMAEKKEGTDIPFVRLMRLCESWHAD